MTLRDQLDRPLTLLDHKLEQLAERAINEGTDAIGHWNSEWWRRTFWVCDRVGSRLMTYLHAHEDVFPPDYDDEFYTVTLPPDRNLERHLQISPYAQDEYLRRQRDGE